MSGPDPAAALASALVAGPPVTPRPAASMILIRGRSPWELLLMRRPRQVDFAAGAHVFPGGSVHPEDGAFADPLRSAAVRELFEEVGVLLARTARGPAHPAQARELARRLGAGATWPAALAELGLTPALHRLTLYARWITPAGLRRRFDTYFYLARVPARHEITPQPGEVDEWRWVPPAVALTDPGLVLVYATRRILEGLAAEPDAAALVRRFRRRRLIRAVEPRLERGPDGPRIVE